MIVTCQECATSFQLDEARIPQTGARVRCSRCKHAFFLPHPSASASQAIQAVVENVVEGQGGGAPEPSRDLGASFRADPDEEDWQFSQEVRSEGDDEAPPKTTTPRPDSFDLTGDFGRGFDPGSSGRADDAAGPGSSATAAPAATAKPERAESAPSASAESAFGSIDDFSSLIADEDVSIDVSSETVPSAQHALRRANASDAPPEAPSATAARGRTRPTAEAPSSAPVPRKKKSSGPRTSPETTPVLDLFAGSDDQEPDHETPIEVEPGARRRLARVAHGIGWCVTLASVAYVGFLALRPEWTRWRFVPQRLDLGPLVAEMTHVGWLETSRSGLLFVVEGELRNSGGGPAMPPVMRVALLDETGARLPDPPLAIGEPLAQDVLREASPDGLRAGRAGAAERFAARSLGPGEVRRFSAIARAEDLPAGARRMLLEAGGPGAQSK